PGHEHRRARDVRRERGVERIAHGIMDAAHLVRHGVVQMPDVGGGHRDEVREASVAVHTDDFCVGADVRVARSAKWAASVHDVPLGGHPVTDRDIRHQSADLYHVARELVSDHEWRLAASARPVVPLVDVHVGAADARAAHTDQDFVLPDYGHRYLGECETGGGVLLH